MLSDADAARTSLQGHIDTTAARVREATAENKRQQDELLAANNALKRQLEAQETDTAAKIQRKQDSINAFIS